MFDLKEEEPPQHAKRLMYDLKEEEPPQHAKRLTFFFQECSNKKLGNTNNNHVGIRH